MGNSAGEGGGVYWLVPSGARGPRLVNNTIADNVANVAGRGSAVFADGFDVNAALENNLLIAPAGQTALHCGNFNDGNPPVVVLQALSENATSIQWLIRQAAENQSGRAIYHSRDGATALGDPELAPTLTFEF